MRNLNLVLKAKYFHMTGEPGKMFELRAASKWIRSRLMYKNGTAKNYNKVEICLGYKRGRLIKVLDYQGFDIIDATTHFTLPNNEVIIMYAGDFIIYLS